MRTLGMLGEVVGIAASICKKHLCVPRDIYLGHLEELKEAMRQGVNIPAAFACGGIDDRESYHFKDIGWWRLKNGICTDRLHQPREPEQFEIEKFKYCVRSLGIEHKYRMPEKWEPK